MRDLFMKIVGSLTYKYKPFKTGQNNTHSHSQLLCIQHTELIATEMYYILNLFTRFIQSFRGMNSIIILFKLNCSITIWHFALHTILYLHIL